MTMNQVYEKMGNLSRLYPDANRMQAACRQCSTGDQCQCVMRAVKGQRGLSLQVKERSFQGMPGRQTCRCVNIAGNVLGIRFFSGSFQ